MRAISYSRTGGSDVLQLVDRSVPEPGPGEVRVRVVRSGVNPTDWKLRAGTGDGAPAPFPMTVPNQDGAGVVDAVGRGVDAARVGERVWIWEAAFERADGTAQELTVVPAHQAVPLPERADFDLGASLGIPFLTAHRALTVNEDGPLELGPGSLQDRVVLVAGGAGAVGNAAIQLAHWADATVITTVSSPEKARLARAAGADHVIDYRTQDVVAIVRGIAPHGVHTVVEVSPAMNAVIDVAVIGRHGVVAVYADDGEPTLSLPVRALMGPNARWQFILVYTELAVAKARAVQDVTVAVAEGAVRVGANAGLPLHHYPLAETGAAHSAVEAAAVGKVLVDVDR